MRSFLPLALLCALLLPATSAGQSGPMRFRLGQGRQKIGLIVTRSATYVRASRGFWRQQHIKNAKELKLLSNRWIKVPGGRGVADLGKQFTPATLARCLTTNLGTVTKRPATTFQGRRVIVLADKGDKPGTSPGLLYLTAAGRVLPVRAVQTGRQRPGGHPAAACGGADRTTTRTDIRFSRFDKPVKIGAPAKALDLTQAGTPS
jgi:hypothetical protein